LCFFVCGLTNGQVIEDVLCRGRVFQPRCSTGNIRIMAAAFGVTDGKFCGGNDPSQWSVNCAVDVAENLRTSCGGKTTCSVPVEGRNPCAGTTQYLQVIWGCDNGVPQNRVNNRGVDIVASSNPLRNNPTPIHSQTVRGSNLYVYLSPSDNIAEARWYIDQTDLVVNTVYQAPFDMFPGRTWDTTTLSEGIHRVFVSITFNDGATGSVDATVAVRNGIPTAAAIAKPSDAYVESAVISSEQTSSIPASVPWSLFGVALFVGVVLVILIIYKVKTFPSNP